MINKKSIELASAHAEKKYSVGILTPSYGMEKLSYIFNLNEFNFKKIKRVPLHRIEKTGVFGDSNFLNEIALVLPNKVNFIHTFNTIPLNGKPFIASFESEFPRLLGTGVRNWQKKLCYKALESERCKGIYALSDRAAENAKKSLKKDGYPNLIKKISVFRGAVLNPAEKRKFAPGERNGAIKLLLVGNALIHKGLIPILDACRILVANGIEIHLSIVGDPRVQTYAHPKIEIDSAKLSEKWIEHHLFLPNSQVRNLMRDADLLLFPSIDESLGWVVVEAGMEGLGSICTNIFALPELVADQITGRIYNLPVDENERWRGLSAKNYEKQNLWESVCATICSNLIETLTDVFHHREKLSLWGKNAYAHIYSKYSIESQSLRLAEIYKKNFLHLEN